MSRALTSLTLSMLVLAMLMPGRALAQDQKDETQEHVLPGHVLLDTVDGATLRTMDGQSIGDIDELIVDTETHQIAFAIVSTGGFLGIGDQLTAIPYDLLQWRQQEGQDMVCGDLTKHNIEMAPKYEHDRLLEHLANEQWRKETKAAFGTYPKDAVITPPEPPSEMPVGSVERGELKQPARWRKAGEIARAKVVAAVSPAGTTGDGGFAAKDEVFGSVDDLVLHRESRKMVAVIVSRGGVIGIDEVRYVIPCEALERTMARNELRVNRTLDDMQNAPRIEKDVVARLENGEFRAQIAKFYGVSLD